MKTRHLIIGGLIAALGTSVAACGADDSEAIADKRASLNEPMKEWYDKALDEPALKYYSLHDPYRLEKTVAAFEEEYPGLTIETLRLSTAELMVRYTQEREEDARTADVITVSDSQFIEDAFEKDWIEEFDKGAIPSVADLGDRWFDRGVATAGILPLGIGYNTDLVGDPPKDWTDVLDSDFEGKIVYPDFRVAPIYSELGRLWINEYGKNFLTEFESLNPTIVDSMVPGAQLLGAGQADLMVPAVPSNIEELKEQGAPVDVAYPDRIVGTSMLTAISTDSPAGNTAKLFYDFLFTQQGQEAFVGTTAASPIGSKGSIPLPPGFVRIDPDLIPETRNVMQGVFELS